MKKTLLAAKIFCPARSAAAALLLTATPAGAMIFPEFEPNDSKATANVISGFTSGDQIIGTSTGNSTTTPGPGSADYFNLGFAAAAPGIYRQQVTLTSGFFGSIRGRSQTNGIINAGSDVFAQFSNAGLDQFYTFGRATSVNYQVIGTAVTLAPYTVTLATTAIAPMVVATPFQAGILTLSSVNQATSDTDLWIYDANFNAIAGYGNDDTPAMGTTPETNRSTLTANFAPGTYYVAISNYNLENDQASPETDNFRTGAVLDSAGALLGSSNATDQNTSFAVTDSNGVPVVVPVNKAAAFDVNFVQFTVVPEPSTWALVIVGSLGLLNAGQRLRRRAGRV